MWDSRGDMITCGTVEFILMLCSQVNHRGGIGLRPEPPGARPSPPPPHLGPGRGPGPGEAVGKLVTRAP
ncbi:unnamed protein product [Boreogadus saida]